MGEGEERERVGRGKTLSMCQFKETKHEFRIFGETPKSVLDEFFKNLDIFIRLNI